MNLIVVLGALFVFVLICLVMASQGSRATKRNFRSRPRRRVPYESSEIVYREENESFEAKNGIQKQKFMNLADDPHGVFGEVATAAIVARVAHDDGRHHVLLQNVYIPTNNGYTELDTVLLHETGIYVFETKNVSGVVMGELEDRQWKLRMNDRTEHDLYNPIKQNHGHIGALMRCLGLSFKQVAVYSVIVFSDRCVLRHVPAKGFRFQLLHFGELKDAMKMYFLDGRRLHALKEIEQWHEKLKPCLNRGEKTKMMHRMNIQKLHGK